MIHRFLLLFLVFVLAGFTIYKMVLSPVSVTFALTDPLGKSHPREIFANSSSAVVVEVFPINRLGFRVPFSHLDGKFVVSEGREKIDIVQEQRNVLIFRTKNSAGRLVIFYYAQKVPFPVEIILNIESGTLAITGPFILSSG